MTMKDFATGVAHQVPDDLRRAIVSTPAALDIWEDITPLARNEWICWVESAKLEETRSRRIARTRKQLAEGKRRPCCWSGCIHRSDKPISPSAQWVLDRQSKKSR